jgi:hypothetical protein
MLTTMMVNQIWVNHLVFRRHRFSTEKSVAPPRASRMGHAGLPLITRVRSGHLAGPSIAL